MVKQVHLYLIQFCNPRFDDGRREGPENERYVYYVAKAVNTLEAARVGEHLTAAQVRALLATDVNITINSPD